VRRVASRNRVDDITISPRLAAHLELFLDSFGESAIMSPMLFALALAMSAPTMNPGMICLSARSTALPEDQSGAYASCIRDEETARTQLRQKWSQFPANALTTCAQPKDVSQSYVELLTCLAMQSGSGVDLAKSQRPPVASDKP
jgi:hypothetical protein